MDNPAYEDMSDDEFMSQNLITTPSEEDSEVEEKAIIDTDTDKSEVDPNDNGSGDTSVGDLGNSDDSGVSDPDAEAAALDLAESEAEATNKTEFDSVSEADESEAKGKNPHAEVKGEVKPEATKPKADAKSDDKSKPGEVKADIVKTEPDYKSLYENIMKPFRANGKEVQLENADEVRQMMQMGANYTRKMQQIAPNMRLVKMLQQNGLTEDKLNFLIDIDKKDPEAIKKLLKDSNIDPMDIDTTVESTHKQQSYAPSDKSIIFDSVLQDVITSNEGKEVVAIVQKNWDKTSKDAIFADPNVLKTLTNQKRSGIYDKIATEVERQTILGNVPEGTPYINAYFNVGTKMDEAGLLNSPAPEPENKVVVPETPVQQRKVVETRAAPRKTVSSNGDKAAAAAMISQKSKGGKSPAKNPLAMSDEDFEKAESLSKRL